MIVVVGGIPGVGKSTVLELFKQTAEKKGRRVDIVNYGTVMFEEASRRGAKHRDEMRKMPIEVQKEIQRSAAERIAKMPGDIKIVDTHFSVKTSSGYLPGIPLHIASALSPDYLVVIRASPEEVSRRRAQDKTRVRDSSIETVREELEMEVAYAVSVSNITGAPLIIVDNKQGEAEKASEELAEKLGV